MSIFVKTEYLRSSHQTNYYSNYNTSQFWIEDWFGMAACFVSKDIVISIYNSQCFLI